MDNLSLKRCNCLTRISHKVQIFSFSLLLLFLCSSCSITIKRDPSKSSQSQLQETISCPEGWQTFFEHRLFFGRNDSSGKEVVSDSQWGSLCGNKTVTPLFPDGLTVYDARGQWLDSHKRLIRERTKVILVLTKSRQLEKIRQITEKYKNLFQQESVLVLTQPTCASF